MSLSGILSSVLFGSASQSGQTQAQKLKQEFQKLGQDLQSGTLSAAQSDFATLQQNAPQGSAISGTQTNNPFSQAFKQLASDLQSGNVSAAQADYATLQQDFQSQAPQSLRHHHHHGGDATTATGQTANPISQLFSQLGSALQSGNLSAAQSAYSTLQQDLQQYIQNGAAGGSSAAPAPSSGLSVTA